MCSSLVLRNFDRLCYSIQRFAPISLRELEIVSWFEARDDFAQSRVAKKSMQLVQSASRPRGLRLCCFFFEGILCKETCPIYYDIFFLMLYHSFRFGLCGLLCC